MQIFEPITALTISGELFVSFYTMEEPKMIESKLYGTAVLDNINALNRWRKSKQTLKVHKGSVEELKKWYRNYYNEALEDGVRIDELKDSIELFSPAYETGIIDNGVREICFEEPTIKLKQPHINSVTNCPTCGAECTIVNGDSNSHYYIPKQADEETQMGYRFPLFNHLNKEHGLTLFDSELDEIINIVNKLNK